MNNSDVTTTSVVKVNHKSIVPKSDIDLGTVLKSVSTQYASCGIALSWISSIQASQLADDYLADLHIRQLEGGKRRPITIELKLAEDEQNKAVVFVKNYLLEKYGKEKAVGFYAEFGLEKVMGTSQLPKDRDRRLESLQKIVQSLTAHGFVSQAYGASYWTVLRDNYMALDASAREKDSLVTNKVNSKNNLKNQGTKFLNAMVNLVKAMYPDDHRSKLREWGFQKERY